MTALFDDREATRFNDEWVQMRERARAVLEVLRARGIAAPEGVEARVLGSSDLVELGRWLVLAATAPSAAAFASAMG